MNLDLEKKSIISKQDSSLIGNNALRRRSHTAVRTISSSRSHVFCYYSLLQHYLIDFLQYRLHIFMNRAVRYCPEIDTKEEIDLLFREVVQLTSCANSTATMSIRRFSGKCGMIKTQAICRIALAIKSPYFHRV